MYRKRIALFEVGGRIQTSAARSYRAAEQERLKGENFSEVKKDGKI